MLEFCWLSLISNRCLNLLICRSILASESQWPHNSADTSHSDNCSWAECSFPLPNNDMWVLQGHLRFMIRREEKLRNIEQKGLPQTQALRPKLVAKNLTFQSILTFKYSLILNLGRWASPRSRWTRSTMIWVSSSLKNFHEFFAASGKSTWIQVVSIAWSRMY